jgi:microcompartment protein CcmL/EutN
MAREEAVGILEVYGLTCAFLAADAGCKAGNVRLDDFDKNKPANAETLPVPLLVTVKFRGTVADVEAAMEAAEATARNFTGVVQRHIIASPTEDTGKFLRKHGFDPV